MITQKRLKELLTYDLNTGVFRWRVKRGNCTRLQVAGHLHTQGYVVIGIDRVVYPAHRLAWLYMYGRLPRGDLDHCNGDRSDNRIMNLRAASRSQNVANSSLSPRNTSGYRGVCWDKKAGRWKAKLTIKQRHKHLGYFENAEDAYKAYLDAALAVFGEYLHPTTKKV